MISGYYVALERTLFYDHIDDVSLKLWEVNVKVHEEGMKLIKPGVACKDIALELTRFLKSMAYLSLELLAMVIRLVCFRITTAVRLELNCVRILTPFCKRIWWSLWSR